MKIEISKGTEEYYKPLKVETNIFYYKKLQDRAVEPFKARASDSGYDLTILEKVKTVGMVEFYSTGIAVQHVKEGWYFDMVPRSSISKSGYILANSNVNSILCSLVSPKPIIPPVHNSNPASLAISSVFSLS